MPNTTKSRLRGLRLGRALSRPLGIGALTAAVGILFLLLPLGAALEESVGLSLLFSLRGTACRRPTFSSSPSTAPLPRRSGFRPTQTGGRASSTPISSMLSIVAGLRRLSSTWSSTSPDRLSTTAPSPTRSAGPAPSCSPSNSCRRPSLRGGDPRALADPFHLERLAPPLPLLAEAAAGLAPFPLPKVPVQVSRYWTFKAGAGNAPSLPVVAFHVYARDAHEPFVSLLRTAGARPPEEVLSRDPALARSGTEHVVRALREAVEQDPETRVRLANALARTLASAGDARVRRLLERLTRLYAGPDSPYLDFYGPPRTIPTFPYDRALALLAGRDGTLDVRGKAVFIGLSAYSGAEQRDGVNTVFAEPMGST